MEKRGNGMIENNQEHTEIFKEIAKILAKRYPYRQTEIYNYICIYGSVDDVINGMNNALMSGYDLGQCIRRRN